ncbi:hypothetical protein GWI33_009604 [Rhynchophorus ferrugineus]|uniref:Uncharacterized protein n=1 Tax=Rhynchophorus ferrugineus TaxID=354439 RepID=A0A834IFG9_RHYFE|nr:hypothetical protein GWI33_009604 [Rhynchophorus ferrugineus]
MSVARTNLTSSYARVLESPTANGPIGCRLSLADKRFCGTDPFITRGFQFDLLTAKVGHWRRRMVRIFFCRKWGDACDNRTGIESREICGRRKELEGSVKSSWWAKIFVYRKK